MTILEYDCTHFLRANGFAMLHPSGAGFFLTEPGGNLSGTLEKRVAGHLLHTVGYALLRAFMSTIIILPNGTLRSVRGCLHISLNRIEGNSDLPELLGRGVQERIIVFGEWQGDSAWASGRW